MATKKRKNASSGNSSVEKSRAGPRRAAAAAAAAMNERAIGKAAKTGSGEIHRLTIYGAVIILIAIISGLALNHNNATETANENDVDDNTGIHTTNLTVDASFGAFWNKICDDDNNRRSSNNRAWCGDGRVEPTRRTFQAATANTKPIRRGDIVAEIPREFQIWEIDALRSDLVQKEKLLKARHKMTENPLASGAFLATYLANERKRLLENEKDVTKDDSSEQDDGGLAGSSITMGNGNVDKLRAPYFRSLPSWEELRSNHPILKSRSDLKSMLGHNSWNFAVVAMYQEMINSEYEALVAASPLVFGKQISLQEYQTARIYVLSRSFNPGPDACSAEADNYFSSIDLERLQSDWGIQSPETIFHQGCHAMVPILDMLNSHPHPNVVYNYHSEKQAFVISAKSSISPQWELMNSYGKFSDAHLFAKFGFVNGDGSGHTQASIALFHRPLDVQISQEFSLIPNKITNGDNDDGSELSSPMEKIPDFQRLDIKRYLMYDDGYDDCVQKDLHPEAFRLKRLKWLHLANIANDPDFWIATLRPRAPESRSRKSSDLLIAEAPPEINPKKLRMDITHLVDTCRLLVLTVDDFEGNAIKILDENLGNSSFVVPKGNQAALEYRSLMFLARMASTALIQYPVNLKKEYDNALQLNKENAFGNSTWTAVQLRLGEMQVRSCTILSKNVSCASIESNYVWNLTNFL
jgi:hypothetical protein